MYPKLYFKNKVVWAMIEMNNREIDFTILEMYNVPVHIYLTYLLVQIINSFLTISAM